ncbi:MAG: hypothetical protein AMXMBFR47_40570 [Planctomycetota bacterium]
MSRSAEFEYDNLRILGRSLAGEETYLVLPEYGVAFDVGRAPREIVHADHVFLSHGHIDHSAGIAYYFAQRWFLDNTPGNLYVAEPLREPVERLLRVWGDIDGNPPPGNVHAVRAGVDVPLRKDLIVRPFAVNHGSRSLSGVSWPALGFALIEVRHKLKDEFQGLSGPELVEIKKQGREITRRVEMPLVAFCGDTAPGPFLGLDFVRRSKILLIECTFIEPDDIRRARAGGHMHLRDIAAALPELENERILLTHLSRRTLLPDAIRAMEAALGDAARERVTFLMQHRPRRRGPRSGGD